MEFGSANTSAANQNIMTLTAQFNSRITDQLVRAGLNYKFDPLETDAPVLITKDAVLVAPWTWAGFYAGFNAGYGSGSSDTDTLLTDATTGNPLSSTDASSSKLRGAIYGAQAGYNLVAGNWLAGIELDFQGSSQGGSQTATCLGLICNPAITAVAAIDAPVSATLQQKLEWFGTLRARLGAVVDPDTLGYFTGGLALGKIKTFGALSGSSLALTPAVDNMGNPILDVNGNPIILSTVSPVATSIEAWTTKVGWSAGAGIERHLGGNLTARVEYLHLDFGKVSSGATSLLFNSTPLTLTYNHRVTDDIVRIGLNYKFDPVVDVFPIATKGPIVVKGPIVGTWSWAGVYLGLNAGYGLGNSTVDTAFADAGAGTPLFATQDTPRVEGGVYGAQAGYNWVAGRWLAGIETDVQYSPQRASLNSACPAAVCNPALVGVIANPAVNVDFGDSPKLDWFATFRSRLGVSITPDTLVYVTGGAAISEITTVGTIFGFSPSVDANGNPTAISANTVFGHHAGKTGWTAGGGFEAHLGGNWTGKVEYLYLDFGTATSTTTNLLNSTPLVVSIQSRVIDHVARAGVNYKFDFNYATLVNPPR